MKWPDDYLGKIFNCDCIEIMKTIPDKAVDLVLTDPPYGIGIDGQKARNCPNPKHNRKAYDFMGWDNFIPPKEVFDEIFRISMNAIIWGGNYFCRYLLNSKKGWLIWDKGQRGLTMSDCEIAFSSFDTATRIFTLNRAWTIQAETEHPTQKPEELMHWCLNNNSEKGQTVFDPFMGSGTTAVACERLGRKWFGCEIKESYCRIAEKRIAAERNQLKLPFTI